MINYCFQFICFVPLNVDTPTFFGFSEYISGLALMVLAWTIADIRYRFRLGTTPLPLQGLTFIMMSTVGILTLLTDLWRAEKWLVPQGNILSPSGWEAILGGVFLITFLIWVWFALIKPPIYGRLNAKRYAQALYRIILKGSPLELSVVADELASSVKPLISYATNGDEQENPPNVTAYANDILLLIADKRLCRSIVKSSPITALAIFREINDSKKYGIQIGIFAKNIVNEALTYKDSFLFHESEGYESGLMGYHKPLSYAMFSNYRMVESIGTLFDINDRRNWDAEQWKAYCKIVLLTFHDYVENNFYRHSYTLYRAKNYIEGAANDLYKINGMPDAPWDEGVQSRLRVVVEFIKDAIEILDKKAVSQHVRLRDRDQRGVGTFYDHLAKMIFEVIFSASAVRSPASLCWWIQHNAVWGQFFNFDSLNGPAGQIVKFKVRRLIYNEIAEMNRFPNFKGAKILGYCLNVMGLTMKNENYDRDSKALHKVTLSWTKKNYAWLHSYNPKIAESCLVDNITYDQENMQLVKTSPATGLRRKPAYIYFPIDPQSSDIDKSNSDD